MEITREYQRDQSSPSTRLRPSAQRTVLLHVEDEDKDRNQLISKKQEGAVHP